MIHKKIPLHRQAEEVISKMIEQEDYKDGKLLPNEVELAKSLNMSRNTLRQAINKLVFEGRLLRKKGYGTWVAKTTITSGVSNWCSFSQEMKMLGIKIKNYELHASLSAGNKAVCKFFNLNESDNQKLLKLERVRGNKNYPFVIFISYFNPNINLSSDDNYSLPLYELLESKYGVIVQTSKEEISARIAGPEIASKLNISENDPILIRKRYVYDINGNAVEYNIGYYRADSFTYSITAVR